MAKPYFPLFVDLSDKRVLVVGGGRIAARRVGTLKRFCDDITVVAPDIAPEIAGVTLKKRAYAPDDLRGAELVIAATNDAALNTDIARECRARGVPVNVASDRALCDFYFPGIAVNGSVVAGVTAGGEDHHLAKKATEAVRDAVEGLGSRE